MTPGQIRASVVSERIAWVREMIRSARALPTTTFEEFIEDPRNIASAESYLRRGIEALLDLGRHMLAKGFANAVTEYKEIGPGLATEGIISDTQGTLLRQIAGYRSRMVHFYHEVSREELYALSTKNLTDLEDILEALIEWLRANPDRVDRRI